MVDEIMIKQCTPKRPESVLVVIYCSLKKSLLLLQRNDDATFWQSVTGSLEEHETAPQAAIREVLEETGIDIIQQDLTLENPNYQVTYAIFPQFRHRYAANVTHNLEHWFYLDLPTECLIQLSEHRAYRWVAWQPRQIWSKSWNNQQALQEVAQRWS